MSSISIKDALAAEYARPGGMREWVRQRIEQFPYRTVYFDNDENAQIHPEFEGYQIPIIPDLHTRMLALITARPEQFDMSQWHDDRFDNCTGEIIGQSWYSKVRLVLTNQLNLDANTCGTTHCRAGWAVAIGGNDAVRLERAFDTGDAATLIAMVSNPNLMEAPDYFTSTEFALEQIERAAELEANRDQLEIEGC